MNLKIKENFLSDVESLDSDYLEQWLTSKKLVIH